MIFNFSYIFIGTLLLLLISAFRILREYERGVIFMLGRFHKVKGPGFIIVIPLIQQMERVDLRTIVMDVPTQDVISRDNVSVKVNAVVYFRVLEPDKAIIQVENFYDATSQLAQTTLRSVLGQHELDEMLSERDRLNIDIQTSLDQHLEHLEATVSSSCSSERKRLHSQDQEIMEDLVFEPPGLPIITMGLHLWFPETLVVQTLVVQTAMEQYLPVPRESADLRWPPIREQQASDQGKPAGLQQLPIALPIAIE